MSIMTLSMNVEAETRTTRWILEVLVKGAALFTGVFSIIQLINLY